MEVALILHDFVKLYKKLEIFINKIIKRKIIKISYDNYLN